VAFKLSMLLDADAKGAKSELARTEKAVDGVTKASGRMNQTHKGSVRDLQTLAAATNSAETEARQLAAAERLAAKEATALGTANRRAAAMTGNLGAQFNDIGVMMASGQSPLQLALQQGTQITQVIGPLGAAGAVRALGTAFLSVINPVSLVTIGSIAAGAAMFQWLTDAGEDAMTLEDRIADLEEGINSYAKAARLARGDTESLQKQFGSLSDEARAALKDMEAAERRELEVKIKTSIIETVDKAPGVSQRPTTRGSRLLGESIGLNTSSIRNGRRIRQFVANLMRDFNELERAATGTLDEQLSAVDTLIVSYKKAASAAGGITTEEDAQLKALNKIKLSVLELQAIDEKPSESLVEAREMLQTLSEQNAIRAAEVQFGEDSAAVAFLRKEGERAILEKQLAQLDVSESIKTEIRGAWEAGQVLNSTTMSDGIKAAADEAKRVADEINRAINASNQLQTQGVNSLQDARLRLKFADNPVELARSLGETRFKRGQSALRKGAGPGELAQLNAEAVEYGDTLAKVAQIEQARREKAKASKAGNRSTQKQVDALSRLIEKEQLQLALLRETDPVQKEMLRNREALAIATDQERVAVAEIIESRIAEQKAIDQLKGKQELFKKTTFDAFQGMVVQGQKVEDVLENIGRALLDATLQAALLGTGPLGSILGGPTGGGLLGSAAQILFPGLAEGGLIPGPGSGTSDSIPIFVSSGEFVSNAKATNKYRHILEAMNSGGSIPGFAAGGLVAPFRGSSGGGAVPLAPIINIQNNSSARITEERQDSVDASGRRQTKLVLSDAVGEALTLPGGGAKRAMRKNFGLQPRGAQR
jgi:tail length tape measure protein